MAPNRGYTGDAEYASYSVPRRSYLTVDLEVGVVLPRRQWASILSQLTCKFLLLLFLNCSARNALLRTGRTRHLS